MLDIDPDRLEHEVKLIGTVDLAAHALDVVLRDDAGFGEVIQASDSFSIAALHHEYRALGRFRFGEEREVVGANVEHGGWM